MHTTYAHRGWRLFVIVVLQAAGMLAVWWFVRRALVPYGGIPGTLVWLAACFALAFWLDTKDGRVSPRQSAAAFTVLMVLNFALFFAALERGGTWGLLATPAFLFFGYRLANVIDERAG